MRLASSLGAGTGTSAGVLVAAFLIVRGLKRFGYQVNVSYWTIFLSSCFLISFATFSIGESAAKVCAQIAGFSFIGGVLVYVASVLFSKQNNIQSQGAPNSAQPSYSQPVNKTDKEKSKTTSVAEKAESTQIPVTHLLGSPENYWAEAMAELESGKKRPGVWAKAFAESEGDETKTNVAYLKARVQQMEDMERLENEKTVQQMTLEIQASQKIKGVISNYQD